MPTYAYLHFMLVHFPIALLVTATGMDWWQGWRDRVTTSTPLLFAIGVLGAWIAVATGFLNRNWHLARGAFDDPDLHTALLRHQWLSLGASIVFSGVLILKLSKNVERHAKWRHFLQAVGIALLLIATHIGGSLSHGSS